MLELEQKTPVPKFEWKEGDTIAIYCNTHKSWIFKGDHVSKVGHRSLKERYKDHDFWWNDGDHDLSVMAPKPNTILSNSDLVNDISLTLRTRRA